MRHHGSCSAGVSPAVARASCPRRSNVEERSPRSAIKSPTPYPGAQARAWTPAPTLSLAEVRRPRSYLKRDAKKPFTLPITPLRDWSGGSAIVSIGAGVVARDMGRVPAPRSGADAGGESLARKTNGASICA